MAWEGTPEFATKNDGTEGTGSVANYLFARHCSLLGFSNRTGGVVKILLGGDASNSASSANWHIALADGDDRALALNMDRFSVLFDSTGTVTPQGTSGATFSFWGYPFGAG